jgi:hypothetical protein
MGLFRIAIRRDRVVPEIARKRRFNVPPSQRQNAASDSIRQSPRRVRLVVPQPALRHVVQKAWMKSSFCDMR